MYLLRSFVILSSQRNQMYISKVRSTRQKEERERERERDRLLRRRVDHILMGQEKSAFLILECSASHSYSNENDEMDFAQ